MNMIHKILVANAMSFTCDKELSLEACGTKGFSSISVTRSSRNGKYIALFQYADGVSAGTLL